MTQIMSAAATHHEHKSHVPNAIGCMVITCSDTRTSETDTSGYRIMHMLKDAGHVVVAYHLVKDEPAKIKAKIKSALTNKKTHAIIVNGGTGISKRDSTFEAVDAMSRMRLRWLTATLSRIARTAAPRSPASPPYHAAPAGARDASCSRSSMLYGAANWRW